MKMNRDASAVLIGLPAQMDPGSETQYLSSRYTDSVAESGGVPVMLPLAGEPEIAGAMVDSLDGVLLTGSHSDLDPALYGAERSALCGPVQALRDRMDFFLLEACFRRKLPVLAICFGIQSLNVFLGGTLIQDIPSCLRSPIAHSGAEHEIAIASGSVLERAAGGTRAVVNSTHHQSIERPGRGLEIVATAPDGVVEAVLSRDPGHWVLGVQWHPEKSFASDGFSRRLFDFFLAQCRAARGSNEGTYT